MKPCLSSTRPPPVPLAVLPACARTRTRIPAAHGCRARPRRHSPLCYSKSTIWPTRRDIAVVASSRVLSGLPAGILLQQQAREYYRAYPKRYCNNGKLPGCALPVPPRLAVPLDGESKPELCKITPLFCCCHTHLPHSLYTLTVVGLVARYI